MKNKVTRFLIYTSIVLLWIPVLIMALHSCHIIEETSHPGFAVIFLALFVMLFTFCQVNVFISILILIPMIRDVIKHRPPAKSIVLVHGLYFLCVAIFSYLAMDDFREHELKTVGSYQFFGLNYALASHTGFLSDVYLVFKLGWYKLADLIRMLNNTNVNADDNAYVHTLGFCLNALLSALVLTVSASLLVIARRRRNKAAENLSLT